MERGFLSSKGSGGGRGVNEKNRGSIDIPAKVTGVMPYGVDGPILSSSGGHMVDENVGEGGEVVVPMESIRAISERFANTANGFFLGTRVAYHVVANYLYGGFDVMLENGPWFIRNNLLILKNWNPDVRLLKEDVGNVSVWVKLYGVPVTAFSEDGRSSYTKALIEVRIDVELKDNIVVDMPKIIEEGFYTCNVRVEYESKPPSFENDVDLGTNGGTSNLASKKANFKRLIIDGKVTLVDDKVKSLTMVDSSGNHDSEDEVASVDNGMANFPASKDFGYGTNSLLEQWKESYENEPRLFYGSRFGSRFGSCSAPVDDDDDSPVEEMSPVKTKKASKCASHTKKNDIKEKKPPKDWIKAEEIALCQAWCDVSENNKKGNSMKAKGFWEVAINYFEKETGSTRGYDLILTK
nr:hypothetical protein [Tanacetum cinerariifolium]